MRLLHRLLQISTCIAILCFASFSYAQASNRLQPVNDTPVIIIDPGHGGENLGTTDNGHIEKDMNLITAQAMYEALLQYEGIEVYLTRTEDVDMTIKDRAVFAEEKNADFVFSIHYNASENHQLFGSEIWVPLKAPFNNYGYQFGCEYLELMRQNGLFIRGIKTRINDNGLDYYGIIRECYAKQIPAVILEHCHVDEEHDATFCDSEDDYVHFGIEDAEAVAKYFGLKHKVTDVDYSEYTLVDVNASEPVSYTVRDNTPPDECHVEFIKADYDVTGVLNATVTAQDKESTLLYYDFSIDGGETYSARFPWPGSDAITGTYDKSFDLSIVIPSETRPFLIVRAYNMYDLFTESNVYESPQVFLYGQNESKEIVYPEASIPTEIIPPDNSGIHKTDAQTHLFFTELTLVILIVVLLLWVIAKRLVQVNSHS